jgi:predicted RNase H-like HicB family nuclease
MRVTKIVYWQDTDAWIGYLQDYPDYWTQGETLDDLKEHLKDLYQDLSGGQIPGIRKVEDLVIP